MTVQKKKLKEWTKIQNDLAIDIQKQTIDPKNSSYGYYVENWNIGYPYTGAIGVDLEYSFRPASIGMFLIVRHIITNNTIDLTDYDKF